MMATDVQIPHPGDIWQHWKGDRYEIVSICKRESDGLAQVVYRSVTGEEWVRPLWEFVQQLTLKGGKLVDRFTIVLASDRQNDCDRYQDINPAPPIAVPLAIGGVEVPA